MARQTRSERRARRAAQAESKAAIERSTRARPSVRPAVAPAGTQDGAAVQPRRRFPFAQFVSESWAELKKVEWPGQNQVIQGTVVVLVACLIVGIYLWLNDQAWKYIVEKVLL
jgi:preprotein translocase subunit SecE